MQWSSSLNVVVVLRDPPSSDASATVKKHVLKLVKKYKYLYFLDIDKL